MQRAGRTAALLPGPRPWDYFLLGNNDRILRVRIWGKVARAAGGGMLHVYCTSRQNAGKVTSRGVGIAVQFQKTGGARQSYSKEGPKK